MSYEISDERAEEWVARFERMELTTEPEVTPLGELYLAVLEFRRRYPDLDGYGQALVAVRVAFHHAVEDGA